jgi:hypothetical protein
MAQDKHQSDQHYMEEELAQSQQNPSYDNGDGMPAEQYASPESMHKRRNSHKGSKSITQGYKG